jgi:hypothetical protein
MFSRHLFIMVFIFSCSAFADQVSVKAGELFRVGSGSILAPSSSGWYIKSRTENEIDFYMKPKGMGDSASIAFSKNYLESDRENLIARVKKYTRIALDKQSKELLTASYQYFEEDKTSCVKFRITVKFIYNSKPVVEQVRGIMCASPQLENSGFLAGYTYISDLVNERKEKEAEAFLRSAKLEL